jgi:hypothetical protein
MADVPEEFKRHLQTLLVLELVHVLGDLRDSPEDEPYVKAVQDEIKRRRDG